MKLRKQMGYKKNNTSNSELLKAVCTNEVKNVKAEFKKVLSTLPISKAERIYNLDCFDKYTYEAGTEIGFALSNGKAVYVGQTKTRVMGMLDGLNSAIKEALTICDDALSDTSFGKMITAPLWRIMIR